MNKLAIPPFLVLLFLPLTSLLAATQPTTGIHLEISPLPILLTAKPGTTVSTDLRVRNAGSVNETLSVKLKKFTEEGTNGEVKLSDPAPNDPSAKWVTFSRTTFSAPPDQWQTIKMTIAPPKEAAFGYYYAVQFQRANPTKSEAGKAAIEGSVGIFVLLNADVPGAKKSMDVVSFTADKSFYEFLPVNFNVKVRNTGNIHFAPSGNIFIRSGKKAISTILVNENAGNVLPQSNRIYTAQWKDGFPVYQEKQKDGVPERDSKGNIKRSLKWDFTQVPKLRIGKYTAHLIMIYDDGHRDIPIEGELSFWVVPWRLLGALLVIGLFALVGFWSSIQKVLKQITKRLRKNNNNVQ